MRVQEKQPCPILGVAPKELMDPSRDRQPHPYVPRSTSCQELPSVVFLQFSDPVQIHLGACLKRCLDLLVGSTVDGDIEICADPVPTPVGSVGVTPKAHSDFHAEGGSNLQPFQSIVSELGLAKLP